MYVVNLHPVPDLEPDPEPGLDHGLGPVVGHGVGTGPGSGTGPGPGFGTGPGCGSDSSYRRRTADVGAALREAVRPGHRVAHIYAQPWESGAAVLFLSQPTLADAERAADDVLSRCRARLTRGSVVPLTMLVELLAQESNPW